MIYAKRLVLPIVLDTHFIQQDMHFISSGKTKKQENFCKFGKHYSEKKAQLRVLHGGILTFVKIM